VQEVRWEFDRAESTEDYRSTLLSLEIGIIGRNLSENGINLLLAVTNKETYLRLKKQI